MNPLHTQAFQDMGTTFALILSIAWGLIWGSFLNVCIVRIPQGKDVVRKPSHCPKCEHKLHWTDNIPVLSFIWLRGYCRYCRAPISWQYPLVEIAAGAFTAGIFVHFGLTLQGLEAWLLSMALIVLVKIDLDVQLLPDVITYPGAVVGFLFSLSDYGLTDWKSSLMGYALGFGFFYLIAWGYSTLTKRDGLGGGDIKLLGMLGAFMGAPAVPVIILASSFTGSLYGVMQMLTKREGLRTALPFGPFLALGAWIHLFWGQTLIRWYLTGHLDP